MVLMHPFASLSSLFPLIPFKIFSSSNLNAIFLDLHFLGWMDRGRIDRVVGVIIKPNPFLLQSVVWIGIFLILEDHDVLRVEIGWIVVGSDRSITVYGGIIQNQKTLRKYGV